MDKSKKYLKGERAAKAFCDPIWLRPKAIFGSEVNHNYGNKMDKLCMMG